MGDKMLLPCTECGAEMFNDGENTTTEIELEYQFGGEQATREVPAMVCPECGEVTAL